MRSRSETRLLPLVLVSVASACATRPPEVSYYVLELPEVGGGRTGRAILAVDPFSAQATYDDERIAYRTGPNQVDYYNYHRWAAPPGLLVSEFLRLAYEGSPWFRAVLTDPTPETAVVLRGRVIEFEEVDVSPDEWRGRVAVELVLQDARSGQIVWRKLTRRDVPLPERSPAGLAQALTSAVTSIAKETAPEIGRVANIVLARHEAEDEATARLD